jgi:UDP-N-acetylmuramyl pentapeptide phosphotransferase/UDP-N-acetylglucosamine-1-phosphate transferase
MSPSFMVAPVAAILVWVLVAVVRQLARRWHLYDHPNARSSHVVPTPRLGGVGLATVLLGGLFLAPQLSGLGDLGGAWRYLGLVGLLVATVSLADDLKSLPVVVRFGVHLAAASIVLTRVGPLRSLHLGPFEISLVGWLGAALLVIWVAGFVNAFNFMDGIDGLAAGQALIAGVGWILLGTVGESPALAYAGWLLVGVSVGFLAHNWPPASIFMGDAGSALLGLTLSAAPLLLGGPAFLLPSVLLVWPFVFDTAFTLVRRARRGEPFWRAHRSHLYQRLSPTRASHRSVALLYLGLAMLGVVASVTLLLAEPVWAVAAAVLLVLAATALWRLVEHRERLANLAPSP